MAASDIRKARASLRAFALALPGAVEEFPWGECTIKLNKKIFVFLGGHETGEALRMSVKLPRSAKEALTYPYASPTGYGLGKSGWVSIRYEGPARPPTDLFLRWIEESYVAIAPKRLTKHRAPPAVPPTPVRARRPR